MIRQLTKFVVFAGAGVFLAHTSGAFTWMNLDHPIVVGSFPNVPYEMKMANWDMGTLYVSPGVGVPTGGTGDNVADANAVNALLDTQALGAVTSVSMPGFMEDVWGIGKITQIYHVDDVLLWQEGHANEYVSAIFYGAVDTYFMETAPGLWHINSVGLHVDMWKWVGPAPILDPTLGSGGRTAADLYTTATEGELILSLVSVPGFLNLPGTHGGPNAEFESIYNATNNSGKGASYMQVTGGSLADSFNTGTESTPASQLNGVPNADIWLEFTTAPYSGSGDWLVKSNDPIRGTAYIPEPASLGLMGLGLVVMFARRRR